MFHGTQRLVALLQLQQPMYGTHVSGCRHRQLAAPNTNEGQPWLASKKSTCWLVAAMM
jgi:hypothetical protein